MATTVSQSLQSIVDDVLLAALSDLVRDSRRNEAAIVAHVAEVDARGLYAREACDSMFTYCTRRLHLSEAEAYLRIAAARASRSHPVLLAMLADGRVHLSAVTRLAPVLTADNRDRVLARAVHASKREILELVAELSPRADIRAQIRKLPERGAGHAAGCHASAPSGLVPCGGADADGADSIRADAGQGAAAVASTNGTAETRHSLLTVTAASSCERAVPAGVAGELCPDRCATRGSAYT